MAINLLRERLFKAKSIEEAASIRKLWIKDYVFPLQQQIIQADVDEKKEIGSLLCTLKNESEILFQEVKANLNKKLLRIEKLDLSIENNVLFDHSFNPIEKIKGDLIKLFNNLNFVIESGKELVSVEDNFENLCVPEDHPSRSRSETFYVDESTILRPHCTVNSVNYMFKNKHKLEVKVATIGYVYRKDDESSRHTHQFSQLDFLWLGKNLNLSNLKWLLKLICSSIFGDSKEYRFRNSYFPFTQPSFEMDIKCNCGNSCDVCKGSGWIEILGSGMLRREIIEKAGFPNNFEGLAGGFGIERIAMIKYGVDNIRKFYDNNFEFLKRW